jgi:hypothetical protein
MVRSIRLGLLVRVGTKNQKNRVDSMASTFWSVPTCTEERTNLYRG